MPSFNNDITLIEINPNIPEKSEESLASALAKSVIHPPSADEKIVAYYSNNNNPWDKNQTTHHKEILISVEEVKKKLTTYVNKEKSPLLSFKQTIDEIDKFLKTSTILSAPLRNRGLEALKTIDKEELIVCWMAVRDNRDDSFTEAVSFDEICDNRINDRTNIFLKSLFERFQENICTTGKENAPYESIAGLHAHAPNILNIPAAQSLIAHVYQDVMYEYLNDLWKNDSVGGLKLYKAWLNDKELPNSNQQIQAKINEQIEKKVTNLRVCLG